MKKIHFKVFEKVEDLPSTWDSICINNHFLQTPYLRVLQNAAPINMKCFYIGIFEEKQLIGSALAQYINVELLESFGERDNCIKTIIRNFIFKNFCSHTLFLGNNMITGENGISFCKTFSTKNISQILIDCADYLIVYFKRKKIKIHLVTFKDFYPLLSDELKKYNFKDIYEFNTQPNMTFSIPENWNSKEDYINSFIKKYRDQYKRARKKSTEITIEELDLEEIKKHEFRIYELYHHVAKNAPFNTFFLSKDHFSYFKKQCGEKFKLFGYYKNNLLIGFHSILLNETVLETYFLGYDESYQKEHMLYLNMLYNMTEFGIEKEFKKIIFGRTALEIKSSIGAKPIEMSGFIFHTNHLINRLLPLIFKRLEPKTEWSERHPFKIND